MHAVIGPLTHAQREALAVLARAGRPLTLHEWRRVCRGERNGARGKPRQFEPGPVVARGLVRPSGERGEPETTYALTDAGRRALDIYGVAL